MKKNNGLAVRPPLGWNSWISFGNDNPEVLAMNQEAAGSRELFNHGDQVAWTAVIPNSVDRYLLLQPTIQT